MLKYYQSPLKIVDVQWGHEVGSCLARLFSVMRPYDVLRDCFAGENIVYTVSLFLVSLSLALCNLETYKAQKNRQTFQEGT